MSRGAALPRWEANFNKLRSKVNRLKKKVAVQRLDALNLSELKDESVDKIVTDPPWGLHLGTTLDISEFYRKMVKEQYRILKSKGVLVILTAQKELLEEVFKEYQGKLRLEAKYDTLVSGQKAAAYKIRKLN